MNEKTRETLAAEMVRGWTMVYAGPGAPAGYVFRGTAGDAVADLTGRMKEGAAVRSYRLVMDDGVWTIRVTWADGSVSTVFASE